METKYKINKADKHFFLYAKGWYKKTDYLKDLAKIHGHWEGISNNESKGILANRLSEIAFDIILKNKSMETNDQLRSFLFDLAPENHWKLRTYINTKSFSFYEVVIKKCLSIIRLVKPEGLDPKNDCDFRILPGKEEENKDDNRK